jgi:hypothetical protein
VEYQRINVFWHGLVVVSCGEYGVCSFFGGGCLESCGAWRVLVVFGALLGPEATGPATIVAGPSGGSPVCGGCSGVSGFPVLAERVVFLSGCCAGCGGWGCCLRTT